MANVGRLLKACEAAGRWANRGPLYREMQAAFASFMALRADVQLTPVANGGIALEAMARLHQRQLGRPLRWVGCSYGFRNLGRGYFSDIVFVDCDERGLLDLDALRLLDPASYDGVIVTNPLGLYSDFSAYFDFARERQVPLLLDNAAGIAKSMPDWPWQAFSLHHTKPFGMGEGGMALTPADHAEALYELIDYSDLTGAPDDWMTNGKLSDLSCAFILDRLERADEWMAQYAVQRERITALARMAGLRPLAEAPSTAPLMSVAFLCEAPLPVSALAAMEHVPAAKYYEPLCETKNARQVYDHVICLSAHAEMARVSDTQISADLDRLMSPEGIGRAAAGH